MATKNIIILGANGMLGQMVKTYFSTKDYEVTEINEKINESNIFRVIDELNELPDGIVINCIGKIKQKSSDSFTLLWSNAIFPLELNRSLKESHMLIQPSTDCVFSGDSSEDYVTGDYNDARDIYGWSKSLGEEALRHRPNTLIIRVSIIGPDNHSDKGLLSWFLNLDEGSLIKGYENHLWNGITTFEWCLFVDDYISSGCQQYDRNTVQLGTMEAHSKYEMLLMFDDIFNKGIRVVPVIEGTSVRKVLKPDIICKDLQSQLLELNHFMIIEKR